MKHSIGEAVYFYMLCRNLIFRGQIAEIILSKSGYRFVVNYYDEEGKGTYTQVNNVFSERESCKEHLIKEFIKNIGVVEHERK